MVASKRKSSQAQRIARPKGKTRARTRHAPSWAIILALLFGCVTGAVGGYFWVKESAGGLAAIQARNADEGEMLARREAELRLVRTQLDMADGELAVERAARQKLEEQVTSLQHQLGEERDRLAFFEQLLPPGPGGSLDVRAASFERLGSALQYRVLLMRNGKLDAPFRGTLRFQAVGIYKGQVVTRELQQMRVNLGSGLQSAAEADAAQNELVFDQYLNAQGVLQVPPGFVPESVTVQVLQGATVKVAHRVDLLE